MVKAAGYLKLAQYPYPDVLTYSGQTGAAIVTDLFAKAGITRWLNISGSAQTFGNVKAVTLKAGQPVWDLINRLDQVEGYITYDENVLVRRVAWSPVPAASGVWDYVQGTNILSISRPRTVSEIQNKVIVTGLPQGNSAITATWQAANPLVPNPPEYIAHHFKDDLIETTAYADTVASRKLQELNRIVEEIEMEVPGNPYLSPGATVTVTAAKVGIASATPFWIKHMQHRIDAKGFVTKLLLEGGAGQGGYKVPDQPDPPDGGRGSIRWRSLWLE